MLSLSRMTRVAQSDGVTAAAVSLDSFYPITCGSGMSKQSETWKVETKMGECKSNVPRRKLPGCAGVSDAGIVFGERSWPTLVQAHCGAPQPRFHRRKHLAGTSFLPRNLQGTDFQGTLPVRRQLALKLSHPNGLSQSYLRYLQIQLDDSRLWLSLVDKFLKTRWFATSLERKFFRRYVSHWSTSKWAAFFFECIFTAKAPAVCIPVLVGLRSLCVGTCGEIILRVGYPTFREAST